MRKTKYHIKKKIMPLLLAVAMAGTATPIYVAHPAIVKAAVSNAFGTNKISLSAGSYTVPVSLKKADDVEQNSMAAGAVGENATLEVAEDGTASLEVNSGLSPVNGIFTVVTLSPSFVSSDPSFVRSDPL